MTQSGTLLGTPSYMSPEQAMGDKLDGRSDIFSLGVCAFEMLAGEQPFPGNNVTSILYKLVHVEPIEPANLEMNGLVPQKWHEVFGSVLAKKPDDRYQTATEFVQDLEYCLGAWFGAVGEMTMAEPAPALPSAAADTGSNDETKVLSAMPDEITMAMPPPAAAAQRPADPSPRTLIEPLPLPDPARGRGNAGDGGTRAGATGAARARRARSVLRERGDGGHGRAGARAAPAAASGRGRRHGRDASAPRPCRRRPRPRRPRRWRARW